MQGFTLAAFTDAEEPNIDVNADGRMLTEIWPPKWHPGISRCDKNQVS